MADGITDAQRNTPPWARGMPADRWIAERGWSWDRAEAERHMDEWHAAGHCRRKGKACDWCEKRRIAAA